MKTQLEAFYEDMRTLALMVAQLKSIEPYEEMVFDFERESVRGAPWLFFFGNTYAQTRCPVCHANALTPDGAQYIHKFRVIYKTSTPLDLSPAIPVKFCQVYK